MNKELKIGYKPHRLIENDPYYAKEIAYVEEINKELSYNSDFLRLIVGKNPTKDYLDRLDYDYLTEDEEKVALSLIQWLGTPVGEGFLESVKKRLEK